MEIQEKIRVIKESFESLRARGIIKTQGDFAELLGVSAKSLSAAKNGVDGYCTDNLISKIQGLVALYEDDVPMSQTAGNKASTILVLPTGARGGSLGDFSQSVQEYECEKIISPVRGADFAMVVTGDSMSPEYSNGSYILIKKIDEKQFIEWGKVFVLDTRNGAVIKQVFPTETDGVVECRSINPCFPPFKVKMSEIFGWYRVLMSMSLK